VKVLLLAGAEVNAKSARGLTPIYRASGWGHTEVIQLLLDSGADPDVATNDGKTPLIVAASSNRYSAVKALLEAGVDVNKRDKEGRTALGSTRSKGTPKEVFLNSIGRGGVIDLLKQAGATE